jgi:CheY-like chemotaxis protein
MASDDAGPFEILILGDFIVRRDGVEITGVTPVLQDTLTRLAVAGGPVRKQDLAAHSDDAAEKAISRLKTRNGLPIGKTGQRGSTAYFLDQERCTVDALDFAHGVDGGADIDGLLQLWRGAVPADVLNSRPWKTVRDARSRLIDRIAGLPLEERTALTELARFTDLFPYDPEVDAIRLRGKRHRPRLLVIDDSPQVLEEIHAKLKTSYDISTLPGLDEWRKFRDTPAKLDLIDGVLIDLRLTADGNDQRGIEIARYLRDHTDIPAALMTANSTERSETRHAELREEFRLVDIVNKQGKDWSEELERTAELLVGDGVEERQNRMHTWLRTAYRKVKRETRNAAPTSTAFRSRQACHKQFLAVLSLVEEGDLDAAQLAVDRFCKTRWTSA